MQSRSGARPRAPLRRLGTGVRHQRVQVGWRADRSFGGCSTVFRRTLGAQKTSTFRIKVNSAKKRLNQMRSSVNLTIPSFDMLQSQFFSENGSFKKEPVKPSPGKAPSDLAPRFVQVNELVFQVLALVFDFDTAIVKSGENIQFHDKKDVLLSAPRPFAPAQDLGSCGDSLAPFSEEQSLEHTQFLGDCKPGSGHALPDCSRTSQRRSRSVRSVLDCGASGLFGSQVNSKYLMSMRPSAILRQSGEPKQFKFTRYLPSTDLGGSFA